MYFQFINTQSNKIHMRKLYISPAWLMIVVLFACHAGKKINPGTVGLVPLNNYFVKNTVPLPEPVNYMFFTRQVDFDNHFGAAKTANNTIVTPDFSGQMVVAVALSPTANKTTLQFDKAEIGGPELNVYYSQTEQGGEQTFRQAPCAVATVPKSLSVKRLNFYNQGNKVKSFDVKF